jgi:hypothetical protein
MSEEKGQLLFVVYCGVILVLFLSLVPIILSMSGLLVRLELLLFVIFLLAGFIGLITYARRGEHILFFMFLLQAGNMIVIWFLTEKLFLLPLIVAVAGTLLAFPRRTAPFIDEDTPEASAEIEVAKKSLKRAPAPSYSTVMHSPGKFAASKFGIVYHAPKCNWAKKIKAKSLVWFSSAEEAEKSGYKPHSCLQ